MAELVIWFVKSSLPARLTLIVLQLQWRITFLANICIKALTTAIATRIAFFSVTEEEIWTLESYAFASFEDESGFTGDTAPCFLVEVFRGYASA